MARALLLLGVLLLAQPCAAAVAHVKSDQGFCTGSTSGGNISGTCSNVATKTFTFTATTTNDAVLILVGCSGSATETTISLSATGWTFTQVGSITGSTGSSGWAAAFKAYAPNTSAATITQTWSNSCQTGAATFINDLIDEFSGMDGTNFVDVNNSATANSTTSCNNVSVTPSVDNDGLWAACNDNQTAAAAGWTKGADDTQSDIAVYKILSGGSGASQSPGFSSSTGTSYVTFLVGIKPAGGGGGGCTAAPGLMLTMGVGNCKGH